MSEFMGGTSFGDADEGFEDPGPAFPDPAMRLALGTFHQRHLDRAAHHAEVSAWIGTGDGASARLSRYIDCVAYLAASDPGDVRRMARKAGIRARPGMGGKL